MKILKLILAVLIVCTSANAANVRNYFLSTTTGQIDTNYLLITKISPNILANGGVIANGVPVRTPRSPWTNFLALGFYSVTNPVARGAYVINVTDDGPQLYDATNVIYSGYNTYAFVYGSNIPPTMNQITNALGYNPVSPTLLNTASNSLVTQIGAGLTASQATNIAAYQALLATNALNSTLRSQFVSNYNGIATNLTAKAIGGAGAKSFSASDVTGIERFYVEDSGVFFPSTTSADGRLLGLNDENQLVLVPNNFTNNSSAFAGLATNAINATNIYGAGLVTITNIAAQQALNATNTLSGNLIGYANTKQFGSTWLTNISHTGAFTNGIAPSATITLSTNGSGVISFNAVSAGVASNAIANLNGLGTNTAIYGLSVFTNLNMLGNPITNATTIAGAASDNLVMRAAPGFTSYLLGGNNGGGAVVQAASNPSGTGGAAIVVAGTSSTASAGGSATISSGANLSTGPGGAVSIQSGTAGSGASGAINIAVGNSTSGAGGALNLSAGNTGSSGSGGNISLIAGTNSASGDGGSISISGGRSATGIGGNVSISGANGTVSNGGSVLILGGNTTGPSSPSAGDISIMAGSGSSGRPGNISIIPGFTDSLGGATNTLGSSNAFNQITKNIFIGTNFFPSAIGVGVFDPGSNRIAVAGNILTTGLTVTNVEIGSWPLIKWTTNNIAVTNAGTASANGTYQWVGPRHYTNQFTGSVITNNTAGNWQIKNGTTVLYSSATQANTVWTLQSGASPVAASYFGSQQNLDGTVWNGVVSSTNLDARFTSISQSSAIRTQINLWHNGLFFGYPTIPLAKSAAVSGDTIQVFPGSFAPVTNIWKNNVDYSFQGVSLGQTNQAATGLALGILDDRNQGLIMNRHLSPQLMP